MQIAKKKSNVRDKQKEETENKAKTQKEMTVAERLDRIEKLLSIESGAK